MFTYLLKRKVLGWVLNSDRVGIVLRLAGSEFQTDGATKLNERSPTDFRLRQFWVFKSFSCLRTGGCVKFDTCSAHQ